MKKIIAIVCSLLLLCGCSQDDRLPCLHCNELVDRWISLENSDVVCGKCFTDRGYLICLNCRTAFDPKGSYAGGLGYCDGCADDLLGYCESCDRYYPKEQLYEEYGLYICALCKCAEMAAIIDDPSLFKFTVNDYDEAYNEGFDDDYDSGYEDGKEDGYSSGNEAGTKTGHDVGYEEGYKAGHEDGRREGYNSGYDAGVSVAASVTRSSNTTKSSNSGMSNSSTAATPSQPQSVTVYITNTGSKYHRSGCQYLSKSKIAISLDDAKSRSYTACSRCW